MNGSCILTRINVTLYYEKDGGKIATYLIVKPDKDFDLVLTEVSAKNVQRAIEELDLDDGDSVKVYRIASGPRTVTVETEQVRKVRVE